MSIVANEGKNVLVNYNYMLRVEGIYDLPCKAVHSFTKENEFDYVQEGGLNDYVHLLRKPVTKPFTFTVERYVGTDLIPPLPLGAELVLPVILMVSPFPNRFDISKRTFVFTGCTVMGKTYGELNAEKSGILTESIVIGYREMVEVTVPVHIGEDGSIWAFDKDNFEGKGTRVARTYDRPDADEIPEKRQWLVEKDGMITYVGDKSAQDRSKFYEAASDKDKLEKRYWKMSGPEVVAQAVGGQGDAKTTDNRVYKRSAKTEPDTDAVARRWNVAGDGKEAGIGVLGGGTASAKTEPDTDAVARQWLKEEKGNFTHVGKKSAQTRDKFYQVTEAVKTGEGTETDEATAKNGPRQWKFDKEKYQGSGIRSAKTEADTDPVSRQWLAEEGGTYKNKGKQSAQTRDQFYKVDAEAAEGTDAAAEEKKRLWKIGKKYTGSGIRSAKTETDTEAESRQWKMSKETAEGGGIRSAKTEVDTEVAGRQWKMSGDTAEGSGTRSAKTAADTEAESRQWKMSGDAAEGGGTRSAKTAADTEAESRQWKMSGDTAEGSGTRSAKAVVDTEAEGRQWKMAGGTAEGSGTRSAKTEVDSDAKARQWAMAKGTVEGSGTRSAKTETDTSAETRKWQMVDKDNAAGGGKQSAVTEKSTKASGRKWPAVSSAKTQQMKETEGRNWKKEGGRELGGGKQSAVQSPSSKPESRKWPKQSSAKTDKMKEAKSRNWEKAGDNKLGGGTVSAVQAPDSQAKGRSWNKPGDHTLGGGTVSAVQSPNSKPERRIWPEQSSAKKRQE